MIVFAREYQTDLASKKQFADFVRWAGRELPEQVSAWRTREAGTQRFFIAVVDESDGRALEFPWHGDPYELVPEQAQAFAARRAERLATAFVAGLRGRVRERIHYGEATAPRLRSDGVWEIPTPQG